MRPSADCKVKLFYIKFCQDPRYALATYDITFDVGGLYFTSFRDRIQSHGSSPPNDTDSVTLPDITTGTRPNASLRKRMLEAYHEELIRETWRPERHFDWCLDVLGYGGRGSAASVGDVGGFEDTTLPSHTHTVDSAGSHSHTGSVTGNGGHGHSMAMRHKNVTSFGGGDLGHGKTPFGVDWSNPSDNYGTYGVSGSGAHSHGLTHQMSSQGTDGTGKNMPPYMVLAFIMRHV